MLRAQQVSMAVLFASLASSACIVAWCQLGWQVGSLLLALPVISLGLVLRNKPLGFSVGIIGLLLQLLIMVLFLGVLVIRSRSIASPYIFLAFICLAFLASAAVLVRGQRHMQKSQLARPNEAA